MRAALHPVVTPFRVSQTHLNLLEGALVQEYANNYQVS
jgi:hypothetical protein